ncbi:unnamed protein product [Cuscuta epithymum]|uniref:Uncharacterized protein n=1 Tax=Cuscuta epithymum TaxID=186058 RepID=A0AAV0F4X0_9ASTE|nr:unnamed protein product [Cuscuta epithymum]
MRCMQAPKEKMQTRELRSMAPLPVGPDAGVPSGSQSFRHSEHVKNASAAPEPRRTARSHQVFHVGGPGLGGGPGSRSARPVQPVTAREPGLEDATVAAQKQRTSNFFPSAATAAASVAVIFGRYR